MERGEVIKNRLKFIFFLPFRVFPREKGGRQQELESFKFRQQILVVGHRGPDHFIGIVAAVRISDFAFARLVGQLFVS